MFFLLENLPVCDVQHLQGIATCLDQHFTLTFCSLVGK